MILLKSEQCLVTFLDVPDSRKNRFILIYIPAELVQHPMVLGTEIAVLPLMTD